MILSFSSLFFVYNCSLVQLCLKWHNILTLSILKSPLSLWHLVTRHHTQEPVSHHCTVQSSLPKGLKVKCKFGIIPFVILVSGIPIYFFSCSQWFSNSYDTLHLYCCSQSLLFPPAEYWAKLKTIFLFSDCPLLVQGKNTPVRTWCGLSTVYTCTRM